MIALVLFDVVHGFSCRYLRIDKVHIEDLRRFEGMIPLANHDAVMPSDSRGILLVSRRDTHRCLTWIGLYKPLPVKFSSRAGDFYGGGIWLEGSYVSGSAVYKLLNKLVDKFGALMNESDIWDTRDIHLISLGIHEDSLTEIKGSERPISYRAGAAFDRVESTGIIDVIDYENQSLYGKSLDFAQNGAGLSDYAKILIPNDRSAMRSVRVYRSVIKLDSAVDRQQVMETKDKPLMLSEPLYSRQREQDNYRSSAAIYEETAQLEKALTKRQKSIEDKIGRFELLESKYFQKNLKFTVTSVVVSITISLLCAFLAIYNLKYQVNALRENFSKALIERDRKPTLTYQSESSNSSELRGDVLSENDAKRLDNNKNCQPYMLEDAEKLSKYVASLLESGASTGGEEARRRQRVANFAVAMDELQPCFADPRFKGMIERLRAQASKQQERR